MKGILLVFSISCLIIMACHPSDVLLKREDYPKRDGREIEFKLNAPYASQVNLYGNFPFNDDCGKSSVLGNLDLRIYSMTKDDLGNWIIKVTLPRGRYYYHFLVDGQHHLLDPSNPDRVKMNNREYSLLIVP